MTSRVPISRVGIVTCQSCDVTCQSGHVCHRNAPEPALREVGRSGRLDVLPGFAAAASSGRAFLMSAFPKGAATAMTVAMQDLVQERRLVTELPGPRSKELFARKQSAVSNGVGTTFPVFIERAGGGVLVDVDGNSLIDLGSGIAVVSVGNSAPRVVQAVTDQVAAFTHTCFMITPYEGYVEVCEQLAAVTPGTTRRSPRCSTPAPRPSRTRSRSPGRPPAAPRSWCSTTPITAAPT